MGRSGTYMTKIIFFGTPDFVVPVLESLEKNFKIVAVVTQPGKVTGRKKQLTFSSVDNWAHKRKIPVITDLSQDFPEAHLGIVAAYGKIIPERIINHFKNGILNIHPSLLPKYRGASPIQQQIIDGITETGVSIIKMDKQMDHGPIVSQFKDEIESNDTNETLRKRLFQRSAQFVTDLIPNYLADRIPLKQQNHEEATFTKIISKEDGFVDLKKMDANEVERKFRALNPWPGIWTFVEIDGQKLRLKILDLHIMDEKLFLDEVQLEGKKPVSIKEFELGYPEVVI
ncbi:methionyl-tRNA formyltransferase [soil metagenome]